MTSDKRASGPQVAAEKRRRSWRGAVLVPVAVWWEEPGGREIRVEAQAKEVNMHGGLVQFFPTEMFPAAGTQVKLTNLISGEEAKARSSGVRRSKGGAVLGVAVELLVSSETFWGLAFRLRKATEELHTLDQEIKAGNVDPSVLREFRESVDYVRTTAWAVQEWQERQAQRRDTATVLPLLVMERIRRAIQLCTAITNDLKESKIATETSGIEELLLATKKLSRGLAELVVPGSDD